MIDTPCQGNFQGQVTIDTVVVSFVLYCEVYSRSNSIIPVFQVNYFAFIAQLVSDNSTFIAQCDNAAVIAESKTPFSHRSLVTPLSSGF
jgi:hypothetical protein